MSGELVPQSDSPLQPSARPEAGVMRLLPKPYRQPVAFFWSLNQHLLPGPLPLVARLKLWIAKEGLTAEECKAVLNRLAAPGRSSRHQFVGQLLADLAAEVAKVVGRRKSIEAMLRRRTRPEVIVTETDPIQQVLDRVGQPTHTGDAP